MKRIGLIGGTGAGDIVPPSAASLGAAVTPWGTTDGALLGWTEQGVDIVYLARHGQHSRLPPHRVNYRANIWALREQQVSAVIGINAVGGITPAARAGRLVLPHQLIDYTWGREQSFFDGTREPLRHVEFDPPFAESLRAGLLTAAEDAAIDVLAGATYGVTQGPRLETAAEIDRLAADGCDIVGMTAMPEAALATEAGLPYAICAVVANRAAGRLPPGVSIHEQMPAFLALGMAEVGRLIPAFCRRR